MKSYPSRPPVGSPENDAAVARLRTEAAEELGREAFGHGVNILGADKEFMKLMNLKGPVGSNMDILKAWNRGWTKANLVAPVG